MSFTGKSDMVSSCHISETNQLDRGRGRSFDQHGNFRRAKALGCGGPVLFNTINNGQTSCFVGQDKVTHEDLPTADTFTRLVILFFRSLNQHCKSFVDSFSSYIRMVLYDKREWKHINEQHCRSLMQIFDRLAGRN